MCEVLDQPTINQFTELDQRLHLMNHELASIYISMTYDTYDEMRNFFFDVHKRHNDVKIEQVV